MKETCKSPYPSPPSICHVDHSTKFITIIMCIIINAIPVRLHYLSVFALSSSALLSFREGLEAPIQGSQTNNK